MKHPAPILLVLLFTSWTAEARIGETAEESKKRYGEEQTLLSVRKQIDQGEVRLAQLTKELNEKFHDKQEKEAASKLAKYERYEQFKDNFQKLKEKGMFDQVVYIKDNKETLENFFNQKIVSFQGLGEAIKKYEGELKWINEQRTDRTGDILNYERKRELEELVKKTAQIEATKKQINELKEREKELADPNVRKDTQVLNFTKGGYDIQCTLKDDKTCQIIYSKNEISGNEVMQTLLNNGDDGVTWENVDDLSNPYSMRYVYYSSDHKLEAIFMKINDSMGILIRERSVPEKPARREAEGLPKKKEEKGL